MHTCKYPNCRSAILSFTEVECANAKTCHVTPSKNHKWKMCRYHSHMCDLGIANILERQNISRIIHFLNKSNYVYVASQKLHLKMCLWCTMLNILLFCYLCTKYLRGPYTLLTSFLLLHSVIWPIFQPHQSYHFFVETFLDLQAALNRWMLRAGAQLPPSSSLWAVLSWGMRSLQNPRGSFRIPGGLSSSDLSLKLLSQFLSSAGFLFLS